MEPDYLVNRRKVYNALSGRASDLGSWDDFNKKLDNPKNRDILYNVLQGRATDLGTRDEFERQIAQPAQSDEGTQSTAAPVEKETPIQEPEKPKKVRDNTPVEAGNPVPYKPIDYTAPLTEQLEQKENIAQEWASQSPMQQEMNYLNKPVEEGRPEEGVFKTNAMLIDETKQSAKDVVATMTDTIRDEAQREVSMADAAKEIMIRSILQRYGATAGKGEITNAGGQLGQVLYAQSEGNKESEKVLQQQIATYANVILPLLFQNDLNATIDENARRLGVTPEFYAQQLAEQVADAIQSDVEEELIARNMPQSRMGWLAGTLRNSILGYIYSAMTETPAQRQRQDIAQQTYQEGNELGLGWRLAGTAAPLLADTPVFGGFGSVAGGLIGKAAEQQVGRLVARGMSRQMAERYILAQTANSAWRRGVQMVGQGAAQSAITLGGYNAVQSATQQLATTGEVNVGEVAQSAVEGAALGTVLGVAGGAVRAATAPLSGAKKLLGNIGSFATEVGAFDVGENLIHKAKGEEADWSLENLANTAEMVVAMKINPHTFANALTTITHPRIALQSPYRNLKLSNLSKRELSEYYGDELAKIQRMMLFDSQEEGVPAEQRKAIDNTDEQKQLEKDIRSFYETAMKDNRLSWETRNTLAAIAQDFGAVQPVPFVMGYETRYDNATGEGTITTYDANGFKISEQTYKGEEAFDKAQKDMLRAAVTNRLGQIGADMLNADELERTMRQAEADGYDPEDINAAMRTIYDAMEAMSGYDAAEANGASKEELAAAKAKMDSAIEGLTDANPDILYRLTDNLQRDRRIYNDNQKALDDAYVQGLLMSQNPTMMNTVRICTDQALKAVKRRFSQEFIDRLNNDPVSTLAQLEMVCEEAAEGSDVEKEALSDYRTARTYVEWRSAQNGIAEAVNGRIVDAVNANNERIDGITHKDTAGKDSPLNGQVIAVTIDGADGETRAYVVGGDVVRNEDGTINKEQSSSFINVVDEEGNILSVAPDDIISVDHPQDAGALKTTQGAEIVDQMTTQYLNDVSGRVAFNEGDTYTLRDNDGHPIRVTVVGVPEGEDGQAVAGQVVVQTADGKQEVMSIRDVQRMKRAADEARVSDSRFSEAEERLLNGGEEQQQEEQGTPPITDFKEGDNFTITLDDEEIQSQVIGVDENGNVEFVTLRPIRLEGESDVSNNHTLTPEQLARYAAKREEQEGEQAPTGEQPPTPPVTEEPEQPTEEEEETTALAQIPKGLDGKPIYEQAPSADVAYDALVERANGNAEIADISMNAILDAKKESLKEAQKALKEAQKGATQEEIAKFAKGKSPDEIVAHAQEARDKVREAQEDVLAAQSDVDFWQEVVDTPKRRNSEPTEAKTPETPPAPPTPETPQTEPETPPTPPAPEAPPVSDAYPTAPVTYKGVTIEPMEYTDTRGRTTRRILVRYPEGMTQEEHHVLGQLARGESGRAGFPSDKHNGFVVWDMKTAKAIGDRLEEMRKKQPQAPATAAPPTPETPPTPPEPEVPTLSEATRALQGNEAYQTFTKNFAEKVKSLKAPIVLVGSREEMLDIARKGGFAQINEGNVDRQSAFYSPTDNKIYFYMPQLFEKGGGTIEGAMLEGWKKIRHEADVHFGLRDMFSDPKEYAKILNRAYKGMSDEAKKEFLAYHWDNNLTDKQRKALLDAAKVDRGGSTDWEDLSAEERTKLLATGGDELTQAAADEYIAHLAEKIGEGEELSTSEKNLWDKIVAWLQEVFGTGFTEQDLVDLVLASHKRLEGPLTETQAKARGMTEQQLLQGVPEFQDETGEQSRKRGYRAMAGHVYWRKPALKDVLFGKETAIGFSDKKRPQARYALVEASNVQASHNEGHENIYHFLPDAQPNKRTDVVSAGTARSRAQDDRPDALTQGVEAYVGAPVVNARGEVIQGNSRTDVLHIMYNDMPQQAQRYKDYLRENASQFGFTAEDVDKMKNPVLVRLLDVDDATAVDLGKMKMSDLETGNKKVIDAKLTADRLKGKIQNISDILLGDNGKDATDWTLTDYINENGEKVLDFLRGNNPDNEQYISETEYQSALNSDGDLTAAAKEAIRNILFEGIFKDAPDSVKNMFNEDLPDKVRKALFGTMYKDYASPDNERLIPTIIEAIRVYHNLSTSGEIGKRFLAAKNKDDVRKVLDEYRSTGQIDFGGNSDRIDSSKDFSPFAIELAGMFRYLKQNELRKCLDRVFADVQESRQPNLFLGDEPIPLEQALKDAFGEYLPKTMRDADGNVVDYQVQLSDKDVRFSTDNRPRGAERQQKTIDAVMGMLDKNKDSVKAKSDALKSISSIVQAMQTQGKYDRATVDLLTSTIRNMMSHGLIEDMTQRDVDRLLGAVNRSMDRSVGGSETMFTRATNLLSNIIADNQLRVSRKDLDKALDVKTERVDSNGLVKQGGVDATTGEIIKLVRQYINGEGNIRDLEDNVLAGRRTTSELERMIYDAQSMMASTDPIAREAAEWQYIAATIAKNYTENVADAARERTNMRQEKKDYYAEIRERVKEGKLTESEARKMRKEYSDTLNESLINSKFLSAAALDDVAQQLKELVSEGKTKAKAFREKKIASVMAVHSVANKDMEGRPAKSQRVENKRQAIASSKIVRLFLDPLATADQMYRMLGNKSVDGKGWLYNHFIQNGWNRAREKELSEKRKSWDILDNKVREVFGDKKLRWSDMYSLERGKPGAIVKFWNGEEYMETKLTQGNLLYVYMVNKMTDGKMKLRRMGISEDDVRNIEAALDPQFKEIGDWLQEEYFPSLREKYNETYKEINGISMDNIPNYVPLHILSDAIHREEDMVTIGDNIRLPATMTGALIRRTMNTLPIDILHSDAFAIAEDHVNEMEHWNAYAHLNQDICTLLSYNPFKNAVKNMSSLYGGGNLLWDNFKKANLIMAGTYISPGSRTADRQIVNVARRVTQAKISLRLFTAFKQLFSAPAYLSDANPLDLVRSVATPRDSWKWCMENLPIFKERWLSKTLGDTRLLQMQGDWDFYRKNFVDRLAKLGMSPNAFVDATTVAVGAKAMYDTAYRKYRRMGFDEETASQRAKDDATILFNETQQSNENVFAAPIQLDTTFYANMVTVFRNSSMGFTRQAVDATRNLKRMLTPGYRQQAITFRTEQLIADGLTEEQARRAATREYNHAWLRNITRMALFSCGVEFAWNIARYVPYLVLGKDDDKKKEMFADAWKHALWGPLEGLTWGEQISELGHNLVANGTTGFATTSLMPLMEDVNHIIEEVPNDHWVALNDIINLAVQLGTGVNQQTIEDAVVAAVDAAHGSLGTAREGLYLALRFAQVPQSQIDELFIDDLNLSAREAQGMTKEELVKRYADYKARRAAGVTWGMHDEEQKEKAEEKSSKSIKKKTNERLDKAAGEEVLEEYKELEPQVQKAHAEVVNNDKKIGKYYDDLYGKNSKVGKILKDRAKEYYHNSLGEGVYRNLDVLYELHKLLSKGTKNSLYDSWWKTSDPEKGGQLKNAIVNAREGYVKIANELPEEILTQE